MNVLWQSTELIIILVVWFVVYAGFFIHSDGSRVSIAAIIRLCDYVCLSAQ